MMTPLAPAPTPAPHHTRPHHDRAGQPAPVCTLDTSSDAFQALGLKAMARQQHAIFDVVLGCQRSLGVRDMSLTEIRDAYERRHGKRIDLNRVSARVSNLVAMQWLARRTDTRPCSISGRQVHPVYVPEKQARLIP